MWSLIEALTGWHYSFGEMQDRTCGVLNSSYDLYWYADQIILLTTKIKPFTELSSHVRYGFLYVKEIECS